MGELHIEIIHDRIRREYGIETHLGPLQVAYRETILHQVSATGIVHALQAECKSFLDLTERPPNVTTQIRWTALLGTDGML